MRCISPQSTLRELTEQSVPVLAAPQVELEMEHGNSEVPARRRLTISFLDVIYGATLMEGAKQHRFVRVLMSGGADR